MDKNKVAKELLKTAKELLAGENEDKQKSGNKKVISRFIKENEEALKSDEYEYAKFKLTGPKGDTKWTNISIADLKAIEKVLK